MTGKRRQWAPPIAKRRAKSAQTRKSDDHNRSRRLSEPVLAGLQLVPGDEVTFTHLEDGVDIPQDNAAERTPGERVVSKSPRRGGKAATQKAVRTRMAKKKANQEALVAEVPVSGSPTLADVQSVPRDERFSSSAERLAELMRQIEDEGSR